MVLLVPPNRHISLSTKDELDAKEVHEEYIVCTAVAMPNGTSQVELRSNSEKNQAHSLTAVIKLCMPEGIS